jgi:hypothetical protein
MTSKLKTDVLETVSGSGTIALTNQLSGMTSASLPTGLQQAFHAHNNGQQSVPTTTTTKILFQTELFDGGSDFASSRFTATSAGKYYLYASLMLGAIPDQNFANILIKKNGSVDLAYATVRNSGASYRSLETNVIVNAAVDDYFEVFLYNNVATVVWTSATGAYSHFGGYKLL